MTRKGSKFRKVFRIEPRQEKKIPTARSKHPKSKKT